MPSPPNPTPASFDVLVLVAPVDTPEVTAAVLAELPAELPAAVLVRGASGAVEVFRRHTGQPVELIENGSSLQPGHVYLSPPHTVLEMRPGGRCAVTPPEGELSSERPLDRLLASLAVSFGSRALAVILAGPGHDGVMGVRALHGAGGTVLVQDPETAAPAELPRAVMKAGAADLVLPREDLGRAVADLLAGEHLLQPPGEATTEGSWTAPHAPAKKALLNSGAQGFLLRLSDALRPLADPVDLVGEACRLLAEQLDVDRAYYVEVDEAAGVARVARDWVRGGAPSLAGEHRVADFGWSVAILRRGECHVVTDTRTSALVPPEDRPASAALGIIACMGAPLIKGGRLVGALCVTNSHPRVWQESEVELLREVAERIRAAVERVRAEEALRESEAQQAFLLTLSDALAPLTTPSEIAALALTRLCERLDINRVLYGEIEGDLLKVEQDCPRGVPSIVGEHSLEPFGPGFLAAYQPGAVIQVNDVEADPKLTEGGRAALRERQVAAFTDVVLYEDERQVALFAVQSATPRAWTPRETDLIRGVAERTRSALRRARAEETLRALNATLEQRVEERTRRLAELNTELKSRTRALEAFAELTRNLTPHLDPYALIRWGQEVALSLLPDGFATYYEPEGGRWRLRAQVGDMPNPALQAAAAAGFPVGGTPSLDRPWGTGTPLFQERYHGDIDGLGELGAGVDAGATFPLSVDGARLGVLAVALFGGRAWSASDRAVLETVVRSLSLALERAAAVRALAEEREALAAFADFTDRAADTREVGALIRQATDVLGQVLDVNSAVYFEREGEVWRLRHASGSLPPELEDALRGGVPAGLPGFALPEGRREPMFFEHWNPGARTSPAPVPFTALAAYPLFPADHPAGMLSMAVTDRPMWTEREKAVFRAVGDSFRLALERTARLQQVERQRERLADLNAELGALITRTAHNLEVPVGYLSRFLEPGSTQDLLAELPPHAPSTLQDELARLRGVSRDLRELARLEDQHVNRELLPLGELFAEVRAGAAAGDRVQWLIRPLPIVRGDQALLKQALEVLLTFTLSDTRGARYVDVSSQEVAGEVWVTVQDDGTGLTGEEAATLFDLSVRTNQDVPLLEGSGLALVRRVLARHGGWAWAESRLNGGKVVLAFPRDETVTELEALFRQDERDT